MNTICRPNRSEGKHSGEEPKKTKVKISSSDEVKKNREPLEKKDLFLTSREKLLRAYGGCLGAECRRRTWDTAKSPGEL